MQGQGIAATCISDIQINRGSGLGSARWLDLSYWNDLFPSTTGKRTWGFASQAFSYLESIANPAGEPISTWQPCLPSLLYVMLNWSCNQIKKPESLAVLSRSLTQCLSNKVSSKQDCHKLLDSDIPCWTANNILTHVYRIIGTICSHLLPECHALDIVDSVELSLDPHSQADLLQYLISSAGCSMLGLQWDLRLQAAVALLCSSSGTRKN